MQAQALSVFGTQHFLESGGIASVVSAPIPMVGNRLKMVVEVYNIVGTSPALTIALEGSILGQVWDSISSTFATIGNLGGFPSNDITITYAMLRVRVTIGGSNSPKAWFNVGMSMTQQ